MKTSLKVTCVPLLLNEILHSSGESTQTLRGHRDLQHCKGISPMLLDLRACAFACCLYLCDVRVEPPISSGELLTSCGLKESNPPPPPAMYSEKTPGRGVIVKFLVIAFTILYMQIVRPMQGCIHP